MMKQNVSSVHCTVRSLALGYVNTEIINQIIMFRKWEKMILCVDALYRISEDKVPLTFFLLLL